MIAHSSSGVRQIVGSGFCSGIGTSSLGTVKMIPDHKSFEIVSYPRPLNLRLHHWSYRFQYRLGASQGHAGVGRSGAGIGRVHHHLFHPYLLVTRPGLAPFGAGDVDAQGSDSRATLASEVGDLAVTLPTNFWFRTSALGSKPAIGTTRASPEVNSRIVRRGWVAEMGGCAAGRAHPFEKSALRLRA
jgi:hypothetical protein